MSQATPVSALPEQLLTSAEPTAAVLEAAYELGRITLAPVLAAFATLLLLESRRRGLKRLTFLARDGHFLMTVTERISAASATAPQMAYVHLTRRSTALAAAGRLEARELAATAGLRADGTTWGSALAYYGIDDEAAIELLSTVDADATAPLPQTLQIARIIDREAWRSQVAFLAEQRRKLLAGYLREAGLADGTAAIVDIGWRATIQRNLMQLATTVAGVRCPAGLYLGLWADDPGTIPTELDCTGLLSDQRRHRRLAEAGAWYAAFLLEAICRADEGTTVGYCRAHNTVEPVLAGPSAARSAESRTQNVVARIRKGILNGVAEWQSMPPPANHCLRQDAQRQLLRLAFFPDAGEIAVASHLVHTEGHAPNWSTPLVAVDRPNPFLSPRRWLAGLGSPWRAGYVRASAGVAGASLFAGGEALLIAAPPALRATLQSAARRYASRR